MSSEDKPIEFVPVKEEDQISRKMLAWLNAFPDVPLPIDLIDYEFMDAGAPGMSMSLVQSAYVVDRFIHGPYTAEYQFKIIYRTKPSSPGGRLDADEMLDALGRWADAGYRRGPGGPGAGADHKIVPVRPHRGRLGGPSNIFQNDISCQPMKARQTKWQKKEARSRCS